MKKLYGWLANQKKREKKDKGRTDGQTWEKQSRKENKHDKRCDDVTQHAMYWKEKCCGHHLARKWPWQGKGHVWVLPKLILETRQRFREESFYINLRILFFYRIIRAIKKC